MKLGIIDKPCEAAFERAQRLGLSFVEFCINVGQDVDAFCAKADELLAFSQKYDIDIGCIGRWATNKIAPDGSILEDELSNSKKMIDTAEKLGCGIFVTGVNYVEGISYYSNITAAIQFLQDLVEYGAKHHVKIAVCNCRWNNYICSDPEWELVLGHIPQLWIKYDTSHCIYAHGDYLSETRKWGNRFAHVHIKGALMVDGERFDDPPAGLDQTNWGAFIGALYAAGYDGLLSIEPHSAIWKSGPRAAWGVRYTVDHIRPLIYQPVEDER